MSKENDKNVIIVTYDISDDKTRTMFAKFLEQHGIRIQYSVFEIQNSDRVLNIIRNTIKSKFEKKFELTDSVYVFTTKYSTTERYGSAKLLDDDLIIL